MEKVLSKQVHYAVGNINRSLKNLTNAHRSLQGRMRNFLFLLPCFKVCQGTPRDFLLILKERQ
jgi:hypothetical protein